MIIQSSKNHHWLPRWETEILHHQDTLTWPIWSMVQINPKHIRGCRVHMSLPCVDVHISTVAKNKFHRDPVSQKMNFHARKALQTSPHTRFYHKTTDNWGTPSSKQIFPKAFRLGGYQLLPS